MFQILIVGLVRSVQETPTRLDYVIDDGTAQIDVKQFVDTDVSYLHSVSRMYYMIYIIN